ncbi:putative GntR transcriptional regulatory protein [Gordonia spumicola]|uniref:Putative GntR transcriptional regulatory protein n=1 Tax=Gordonia spumicola TaxID=589161 RepID=A0A7I9VDM9_9ACTN|nr:GntR family transcriptional regulator [Gordonia spumicola]GEE03458.1 putative GntR transcriptional regulatory protein [Gordonia spumicola]
MASESHAASALRRRPQLSDEVAATVRHKIMTAELLPGERVRLDATAAALGVSVTPVREALLTLRGEGMVAFAPHRGYTVADLTRTDVADLFWLQGEAAARIARRTCAVITTDEIGQLESAQARLGAAAASGDVAAIVDAEFDFHRTHNHIAGSGKLAWILQNATRYTPHQLYAADAAWIDNALTAHASLVSAYRSGDADAAAAAVRAQFDDGARRLIRHLESTPIWD